MTPGVIAACAAALAIGAAAGWLAQARHGKTRKPDVSHAPPVTDRGEMTADHEDGGTA